MEYVLLIYENEAEWDKASEQEKGAIFQEYMTFTEGIVKTGQFKGGDALQPIGTATTVRVRGGKTLSTDGPFAETREQLGGFFKVEAKNLDEAIAIAARIPGARSGSIEIRPVMAVPMPKAP
jgi:hypothetical protein